MNEVCIPLQQQLKGTLLSCVCVWGWEGGGVLLSYHITRKASKPFDVQRGMESCSPLHYIQIGFKWDFAPSHLGVHIS